MFYFEEINGKKVLKSSALADFSDKIDLIFTTKECCIKTKEEGEAERAKANKEALLRHYKIQNFFEFEQTHSTNIKILEGTPTERLKDTDGGILAAQNVKSGLILNFADCTPVALYDPIHNIFAGVHAGWRGTAGGIAPKCVKFMEEKFDSKNSDIIGIIGPCIAQSSFETGLEVYQELKKTVKSEDGLFEFKGEKAFPDLAEINARQLKEIGVKTVDISPFKTTLNNELFYSYRLENRTTSRISMVLTKFI